MFDIIIDIIPTTNANRNGVIFTITEGAIDQISKLMFLAYKFFIRLGNKKGVAIINIIEIYLVFSYPSLYSSGKMIPLIMDRSKKTIPIENQSIGIKYFGKIKAITVYIIQKLANISISNTYLALTNKLLVYGMAQRSAAPFSYFVSERDTVPVNKSCMTNAVVKKIINPAFKPRLEVINGGNKTATRIITSRYFFTSKHSFFTR